MSFIRNDSHYCRYYDEFNVLLGTGMRVSEFCGLTKDDLDFKNRRIFVEKQLIKERNGTYHIEKTKTESGVRYIPMTDSVCESLQNILKHRIVPSVERIVDGYTGFILLDKNSNPKHVMRHTFCTNMANAGMDLKSLQYLMGHSDAAITMNVYTHASYERAEEAMQKILQFKQPQEVRKTG